MITEDERKAQAAARARAYRARKREQESKQRDVRRSSGAAPRTMRNAVAASLKAMKWIVPSDAASVAQAKSLAKQIDELEHSGDTVRALSAHRALSRVLNDLGGTPSVRLQHELRSLRAQKQGGDDGGNDEAGEQPSNVSQFKRPEKRRRS